MFAPPSSVPQPLAVDDDAPSAEKPPSNSKTRHSISFTASPRRSSFSGSTGEASPSSSGSGTLRRLPDDPIPLRDEMLSQSLNGWELKEKLGEGSFGKVFKAQHRDTAELAAVKIVPAETDTGEVAREIKTLKECISTNIVRYYDSFTLDHELWIIMEFCAGSSLSDIMEARKRCLTEAQIAAAVAGTIEGLRYLHGRNLIHRDVKAGNLLLSDQGIIKLADFGVVAQLHSTMSKRGTVIGTPFWMAPEVISGGPEAGYNTKVRRRHGASNPGARSCGCQLCEG